MLHDTKYYNVVPDCETSYSTNRVVCFLVLSGPLILSCDCARQPLITQSYNYKPHSFHKINHKLLLYL